MWKNGQAPADAFYWSDGMGDWEPIAGILPAPKKKIDHHADSKLRVAVFGAATYLAGSKKRIVGFGCAVAFVGTATGFFIAGVQTPSRNSKPANSEPTVAESEHYDPAVQADLDSIHAKWKADELSGTPVSDFMEQNGQPTSIKNVTDAYDKPCSIYVWKYDSNSAHDTVFIVANGTIISGCLKGVDFDNQIPRHKAEQAADDKRFDDALEKVMDSH